MLLHTRTHTSKHARTRRRTHTVSNILLALHQHHHNIIIIIIISAGSAAFVIVIVPYCCCYCFSCCRQPTNTQTHANVSLLTKCLSLFPHKLHSMIFSIFFTLRTLARFQIFVFVFFARRLRDTCDYVDVTKRSDGALSVSTQRSSAHL